MLLKITYNCPNKNTRIYSKCSGELHNYLNNNESSLGDFLPQCIQCINSIPNTKYQKFESDYTTLTRFFKYVCKYPKYLKEDDRTL